MGRTVPVEWVPTDGGPGRGHAPFTYDAYLPDPLADQKVLLPAGVAQAITAADAAVRQLARHPAVAAYRAIAVPLLRAEAVSSSRYEGLVVSHRHLAEAMYLGDRDSHSSATTYVIGNIRAMQAAIERAQRPADLTVDDITAIHAELMKHSQDREWAGVLRTGASWIGGSEYSPRKAAYIGPPGRDVRPLMVDLCDYLAREDAPAVLQAAIAHAQFELIHPFADGNGRVGRCLIHAVLLRRGTEGLMVPPVSAVLAANGDEYIAGLTAFKEGDTAPWAETFANAVELAAKEASVLADDIATLTATQRAQLVDLRRDASAVRLLSFLPANPIIDRQMVERLLRVSDQSALTGLGVLAERGVLKEVNVGSGRRAFIAKEVFDLLNEFERRIADSAGPGVQRRPVPHPAPADRGITEAVLKDPGPSTPPTERGTGKPGGV